MTDAVMQRRPAVRALLANRPEGLVRLVVGAEALPKTLPPRDGAYLKTRLRAHLGLAPT